MDKTHAKLRFQYFRGLMTAREYFDEATTTMSADDAVRWAAREIIHLDSYSSAECVNAFVDLLVELCHEDHESCISPPPHEYGGIADSGRPCRDCTAPEGAAWHYKESPCTL